MTLKLFCLVPETRQRMSKIPDKAFYEAREYCVSHHTYTRDPETYLAALVRDSVFSITEICDIYHDLDANDDHILSLIKYCMRKRGWIK